MSTPNTDAPIALGANTLEEGGPLDNSVTFANDEPAPSQRKTASQLRSAKDRASLSQSAKAWDLDGDGELDDAELALKNMDKSHTGTLNKDQMYKLMAENLNTQRELFKVKKVVIGLVVFAAILAISNLGTSLAAAFLAKDTKSTDSKLTDSKSGRTLGTANTIEHFVIDKEFDEDHSRRRLIACDPLVTGSGRDRVTSTSCTGFDGNAIPATEALEIIDACDGGQSVSIDKVFGGGATTSIVPHDICRHPQPIGYVFGTGVRNGQNNKHSVTITGLTTGTVVIEPDANDSSAYLMSGLLSAAGQSCDVNTDCASGLRCDGASGNVAGTCVLKSVAGETCVVDEDWCASGFVCEDRTCKVREGGTCTPSDALCASPFTCVSITTPWGTVQSTCQCTTDTDCGTNMACTLNQQTETKWCKCTSYLACTHLNTATEDGICSLSCAMDVMMECTTQKIMDEGCGAGMICRDNGSYFGCEEPLGGGRE